MKVTIWSSAEEKSLDVEFTDTEHERLLNFVSERAHDGRWFTSHDIDELMPTRHLGDDLFDTIEVVRPFLPDGFCVGMHGYDDFCVTRNEAA